MGDRDAKKKVIIRPSDIPPSANAFAGAVGGAVANLSVFPLDLITTRLMVQSKVDTKQHYDGIVDAFRKIYAEEGIAGFYDGAGSDVAATMTQAFFYFFAYEKIRKGRVRQLARRNGGRAPSTLGAGEELLIGTLAGVICKFFTAPLNNIVARQQTAGLVGSASGDNAATSAGGKDDAKTGPALPVKRRGLPRSQRHPSRSALEVVREIYAEKGILGFWAGYRAVVLLSFNPSLTYYFFQLLRVSLIPRRRRENPTSLELFFLAAFAKTFATLITYPIMLSKTRMQIKLKEKATLLHSLYRTLRTEGVAGAYVGARSQILKGFFSQGITMMTKDQIARAIIYLYFWSRKRLL